MAGKQKHHSRSAPNMRLAAQRPAPAVIRSAVGVDRGTDRSKDDQEWHGKGSLGRPRKGAGGRIPGGNLGRGGRA